MNTAADPEPGASLVALVYVTYGLYALGLVIAPFAATTRLGDLLLGWPPLVAMIIGFVKQPGARGTWLESHFRWQMRTVWLALAWAVLVAVATLASGLGGDFSLWRAGIYAIGVWATYRLVRGLLKLRRHEPLPG